MFQDAGSVGSQKPQLPSFLAKTSKRRGEERVKRSPVDIFWKPRPRRKTDSAIDPTIHAPQKGPHVQFVVGVSRRSMMEFSRPTTSYGLPEGHSMESTGPTTPTSITSRLRPNEGYDDFPDMQESGRDENPHRRSTAIERRRTTDDPRDTGRDGALTSAGTTTTSSTSDFSAPSFIALPASHPPFSSPSSPSRLHQPSPPSLPRLPQSRFSFEYQYPLRKRALTSHFNFPNIDHATLASDSTAANRNLLYDRPRRSVPDFSLSHDHSSTASLLSSSQSTTVKGSDSALSLDADPTVRVLSPNATKRRKQSLYSQPTPTDVKRRMPSSTATYVQGRTQSDQQSRVNGNEKLGHEDGLRASIHDDSRSKNEDIFLNIARSDSGRRESFGRSELRRSRFRMSGNGLRSSTSRVSDQTPSPDQLRLNSYDSPLHSQNASPSAPYSSVPYSYPASAHPLEDTGRSSQSIFASSARSTLGLPRSRLSRASPEHETTPERRSSLHDSRTFRPSTLSTIRSSRQVSSSEATERPRYEPDRSRQDGTESTLSTTAPSTVWDELEDLKSRIKKLELTGKLPPSSQEAITSASGERPRTATTTVTTVSSSPRHGRRKSISGESETVTVPSPVYPLLQSALAKAKNVVGREVYTALETTATDAIALSSLLGSGTTPSGNVSTVNGYGSMDRQSRRKADSVCRSLTELCLALSDGQVLKQHVSTGDLAFRASQNGTDEGTLTPTLSYRRSVNQESEEAARRQSGTRIASRLEARRMSQVNNDDRTSPESSTQHKNHNAHQDSNQAHKSDSPATASRLSRLSMTLRTKRTQGEENDSEKPSPHSRSISRSMTDIGSVSSAQRPPPRQRPSRGYSTSQPVSDSQPLLGSQPRTPTAASQSGIPLRRSIMTPSLYTPATSRSNIQAGSRRYGMPSTDAPNDDIPTSPRTQISQTKIISPSSKLASSYTPISQNRFRTNSLGARRLGIRQRPVSTVDDGRSLDNSID